MRESIRKRLMLGFITIITVGMVTVNAINVILAGGSLYDRTIHEANYALIAEANAIDGKLDAYDAILNTLSADLSVLTEAQLQNRAYIGSMLDNLTQKHPEFVDITFAYPDGSAIFASNWIPPSGYTAAATEWYRQAVAAGGSVVFTKPFVEPKAQKLVIAAAVAKIVNGKVSYVASVEISMQSAFDMVDGLELGTGSYGFLINRDGDVYHHPHENYAPSGADFAKLDASLDAIKSAGSDQADFEPVRAKGPDGKDYYFFAQGSGMVDWVLGMAVPAAHIWGPIANMVVVAVGMTALAIVVSLLIYSRVLKIRISDPVGRLTVIAGRLAEGRIDNTVEVTRTDEIGKLQRSFQSMQATISEQVACLKKIAEGDLTVEAKLLSDNDAMGMALTELLRRNNRMLGDIRAASFNVSAGAQQIADGASALATGSTEQAATVEEFSSTIAALKEHADQSAKMAVKTQKDIEKVGTLMLEGLDSMDRMTRAMDAIDASSQQIASIIKVIEEIAFKTNILALNAAVEAARAGTHGRGFAVVADEVRNLASQSATAAKETAELIGTSVDHVQSGSAILKETANSIKQLGGIAEANVDQMKRLSELFQRQEQLIADLNAGIDQIAGVVQTNASTAEENAAASQEMSMQSVQLNEIVGRFKIREDNV